MIITRKMTSESMNVQIEHEMFFFMPNIPTQKNGFDCGVFVCMVSAEDCLCFHVCEFNFFSIVYSL